MVIFRKRWEGMQRKDIRQSVPVLCVQLLKCSEILLVRWEKLFDDQHLTPPSQQVSCPLILEKKFSLAIGRVIH